MKLLFTLGVVIVLRAGAVTITKIAGGAWPEGMVLSGTSCDPLKAAGVWPCPSKNFRMFICYQKGCTDSKITTAQECANKIATVPDCGTTFAWLQDGAKTECQCMGKNHDGQATSWLGKYPGGIVYKIQKPGDYIYSLTENKYSPDIKPITTGGYAQFGVINQKLVSKMAPCWNETAKSYSNKTVEECKYEVNAHHQDVERTFVNYATDYTRKMDKVQNGIEGLAQLHSTHDEMWHRICAIAERGAKYRMQEFKNAIQEFKNSMIDFKGKHLTMIAKKKDMEAKKVKMTISLQKWLTARKAHAAAHTRYVNFLHHLGLDFKDKNPAARYWREYSHGVTGGTRSGNNVAKLAGGSWADGYQKHGTPGGGGLADKNKGGKVFGGWTPLQGPIPHLGQHSHKVFIDKLESIAQTSNRVGIFEDPKNPLHNYVYNATHGGRENSGNPNDSVEPHGIYGHSQAGLNMFQTKLMKEPFYNHMALSTNLLESKPTSMPSVSGLLDRSQQDKHNKAPKV